MKPVSRDLHAGFTTATASWWVEPYTLARERIMSESNQERVTDPVCGMQIRPEKSAARIVHDGTTYFFCAEACRRQFELEPDRYAVRPETEQA